MVCGPPASTQCTRGLYECTRVNTVPEHLLVNFGVVFLSSVCHTGRHLATGRVQPLSESPAFG